MGNSSSDSSSASNSDSGSFWQDYQPSRDKFVETEDIFMCDNMLSSGLISHVDVKNRSELDFSALYKTCLTEHDSLRAQYILTCVPCPNVNLVNRRDGRTALHYAAWNNRISNMKYLLDFDADRSATDRNGAAPLDWANEMKSKEAAVLLENYFPSEEQKIDSQLQSKLKIDALFKARGMTRFNQEAINLKFQPIQATKTGDIEILKKSISSVDGQLAVSLSLLAGQEGHLHLLECLYEHLRKRGGDINTNLATYSIHMTDCRILSFFELLQHKFYYVYEDCKIDLVEYLQLEGLFESNELR